MGWNAYRSPGSPDVFNRKYILGLIEYYPREARWMFGGVFEVLSRAKVSNYELALTRIGSEYIDRLLISHSGPGVRGRSFKPETCFEELTVAQILDEPYLGAEFPGYENIVHDFGQLESIVQQSKPDWKAALESVKGIYLITDKKNGRMYVGSAYGSDGIWSRWCCYIGTGHGCNDELTKLIKSTGLAYARENFQLSILEFRPMKTSDQLILEREQYWKSVP
jgi:GIY-YIG catalytic domain